MSKEKELGIKHCPNCGKPLNLLPDKSGGMGMCGSILEYECSGCKKIWREDQSGIVGRPTNLTEVTHPERPRIPRF